MPKEYSNKNLQKASFKNENLSQVAFSGSDLRGADFTGADLTGADLTHVRTGITPLNAFWIFLAALAVSLLAGYIAMLAGYTIEQMLLSDDKNKRIAGIVSMVLIFLFIVYAYLKGVNNAIKGLIVPVIALALLIGITNYIFGTGTRGTMLYLTLSLALVAVMIVVGTVARAAAGSLSNILFVVVALSGGMFGKNVTKYMTDGSGAGAVLMAVACAMISKRALKGEKGFEGLRKVASYITARFGTSFRHTKLGNADFSESRIHNADFSDADIFSVNWGDSRKMNCISGNKIISERKKENMAEEKKADETHSTPSSTELALERTALAHERTLMAWVRTAISLISFGFTLYKIFEEVVKSGNTPTIFTPRRVGMIMIFFGLLGLLLAQIQHQRAMKRLRRDYPAAPRSVSALLGILVFIFGIAMFLGALFKQ